MFSNFREKNKFRDTCFRFFFRNNFLILCAFKWSRYPTVREKKEANRLEN